jgi:hypothetical protein
MKKGNFNFMPAKVQIHFEMAIKGPNKLKNAKKRPIGL